MTAGIRRVGIAAGALVGLALMGPIGGYLAFRPDPAALPLATVADDPSLPVLEIDGRRLHGEVFGDPEAPAVIVLHGGPGGDYRNLLPMRALVEDGFRVVFYDQMGSGLSPRVEPGLATLDSLVEELDAVVDTVGGGERVALIGHSWGAMLAGYYLAAHPEKVGRVVLAEPGVFETEAYQEFLAALQPAPSLGLVGFMLRAGFESLHVSGPDPDARMDYLVGRVMAAPLPENALNAYWCDGVAPAAAHEIWRVGATTMQSVQLGSQQEDGSFAMPPLRVTWPDEVLLIASRCNTLIGVERQTEHLALFPKARLEVIEDAGHFMLVEQPEASLAVIRSYLKGWPEPRVQAPPEVEAPLP